MRPIHPPTQGPPRRRWLVACLAWGALPAARPQAATSSARTTSNASSAAMPIPTSQPLPGDSLPDDTTLDADPPRLDPVPHPPARPAPGRPGDFAFLDGHWRIRHLKRRADGWDRFDGEASCWSILGGVGSIEELRIPARNFSGLGLRLLDVDKRLWNDHWVNARSGVVGVPGLQGGFEGGTGLFPSFDDDGRTLNGMGIWDCIAPGRCRWRQVVSTDGGRSWQHDWVMHWRRVG